MINAIVTDIEGTTSSIEFVHSVLFPYASKKLPDFIRQNHDHKAVAAALADTAKQSGIDVHNTEALITQLLQWIADDKKVTPLKTLQGLIWEHGYRNGDYQAHIYPDALSKLTAWQQQNINLYVYSSGSIYAQKLFFGFNEGGDLQTLFTDYFDTTTGPKREAASYRVIKQAIGLPANEILFLSDTLEEVDAAAEIGMSTAWVQRQPPIAQHTPHQCVSSFSDIILPS
ncbi:Enolase-phosphatase E1 [Zhongshania aliphaticivorans]|uniref:Enolase-phosphatase E1 n=1 Tax=Zhongshania aliphaticivorans TaxID=1470434 RepID=A0A5S9NMZ4_9GAMM|nr:acireductone synthase [Zhongshania aliphaticivorans]CAA0091411.1 Enolase-phosphatase E1 [Zhongshania aliphaticivorans]CAA0098797.1 Enolase-phosphatase E1 [Zhongshania aliphaticivorans]